jgi:mono/diheme cytochrome c family protein
MGRISKTVKVHTNDPGNPIAVLTLTMEVKDAMHMTGFPATEIFKDKCSGCHVEKGKGMTGAVLFREDCIMCHNYGKSASPLSEMRKKPKEEIEMAIREGIKNTSMPGWDIKNGGPLNDEEIESLIRIIKP